MPHSLLKELLEYILNLSFRGTMGINNILTVILVFYCFSGFIIAAFVFNDTADEGVKGVLTAVHNANNTLLEIQSKVV